MTVNSQKSDQQGFTIIEVLIVLAIAGLILLVVLLAVPALNRNSRNTTMKNDVQSVLSGFSDFAGANDGTLPATVTKVVGEPVVKYEKPTKNTTEIKIQGNTAVNTATVAAAGTVALTDTGKIEVRIGGKCDAATTTGTTGGWVASSRAVAAFYLLETSNGNLAKCSDS